MCIIDIILGGMARYGYCCLVLLCMKSSVAPYAEFRAGLQAVVVSVMFVDLEHLFIPELAFTDTVEPLNKGHVGTRSFVLYREVSFIWRLKCTGIIGIGTSRFVLYREVSLIRSVLFQRFHCTSRLLLRYYITPYSILKEENRDLGILRMTNSVGLNVG